MKVEAGESIGRGACWLVGANPASACVIGTLVGVWRMRVAPREMSLPKEDCMIANLLD
jgi:hypothetical protein